jgi:membrane fusion protein
MSLFRKEAVSHQSERLTGAITLAQPLSIKLTVAILVAVAIAIIIFLFNAEYSRKETVRGFLMPNKGVIKSFANQGGTIETLWVSEGDKVLKGQSLATITVQQKNGYGVDLSTQLSEQLNAQKIY